MRFEIGEIGPRATRRAFARLLGPLAVAALALAVVAAPSQALSQRGYVLDKSLTIGAPGSGAGQLKAPAGVAVNQSTGDIYVVDSGNNRVDEFEASGTFIRAWGWGVKTGAKELQVCETECKAGFAGHGKGEFHGAGSIAIDNDPSSPSFGDVYVEAVKPYEETIKNHEVEFEYGIYDKFGKNGELIKAITGYKEKGESLEKWEDPHGVAVGAFGELWIYNEEEVFEFTNEAKNVLVESFETELPGESRAGLAVGTEKNLYLGHSLTESKAAPTLIAKDLIVPNETGEPEGVPVNETVVTEPATGVTIAPVNQNVLIDTGTSVTILTSTGEIVQTLGGPEEGGAGVLKQGTGVAVADKAGQVLVADAEQGRVFVFEQEPLGPPRIELDGVSATSATTTQLTATIAPGGAASTYWFRYAPGKVPAAGEPCSSPCVELPVPHEALAEGGEGDFANVNTAPVTASGLSPSTIYNYVAFAENEKGMVESGEQHFKTQPAVLGETLLDGRSWEQVSPHDKNGAFIEGQTHEGGLIQAAANGDAITYVASNATEGAQGNRAPEFNQLFSTRSDNGRESSWSSSDINTPNNFPVGIDVGSSPEYRAFSPDLTLAVVDPFTGEEPKLSPEAGEHTIYLRHNQACVEAPATCYTPLVTPLNDKGEIEREGANVRNPFGPSLAWLDSNAAATATVMSVEGPLTQEPANSGVNLYEWLGGQLKLVNALTNGTPLGSPAVGAGNRMMRNAISADGSRVIFSAGRPSHLYERNMSTGKTLQVDTPEAGITEDTSGAPVFQAASESSSTIFFTDPARLTHNSTAAAEKPDLYVCEVEEPEGGEPACKLTDLTVDSHLGEAADVQGTPPGAAADGSDVFFVANGALASGATSGNCLNEQEARDKESEVLLGSVCNLYVVHREEGSWGSPKLIAKLSIEDEPDWGAGSSLDLGYVTSRVSPNGEWFAFMSDRSLPTSTDPGGYNNHDVTSGRPDEEVYLYNASTEKLVCASCDPTGARPAGVHDVEESGEGIGLLVDRPLIWEHRWIAANIPSWTRLEFFGAFYQSRFLLDSGRLFFNTSQALVPQDKNGTQDVYEYEPTGTLAPDGVSSDCTTANETYGESSLGCVSLISSGTSPKESAFLDASESGDDVFFDTAASLVKQDTDTDYDVYDATICGQSGTPSCVPPPAATLPVCGGASECRGAAPENPTLGTGAPGTSVASGAGNVEVLGHQEVKQKPVVKTQTPTRAQRYAKALAACKRIKSKHARNACLAAAKKKYGPLSKKAKKSARSSRHTGRRGR